LSKVPEWLQSAREHWRWRGQARPAFATEPRLGQVSVWDFPRPPRLSAESREIVVRWGRHEVVRTCRAFKVLETAHPPSFYLPWNDVNTELFRPASGSSYCEWKGPARYWSLFDGTQTLVRVAWSYPQPLAGAEQLADCVAFYPLHLDCRVGGAEVTPQPGQFYGGWVTPELIGPFKGDPGSESW
jgi:uncharacterized protein (DUF427 family)